MLLNYDFKRMDKESLFLIDIDKILQDKAQKYYKYIPKFAISYLKRIAHQDELNEFLKKSREKGCGLLESCVSFLDMDLEVEG